ncbi:MAG: DMT family transporter, partial [Gemmatimonadetes bacterium]|nr:DMT family transporter [Gemmatimonadota bacterium]
MKSGRLLTGYLLMVVTAVSWAGAWITARLAAHDVPAITTATGRFVVASVILLPFWWAMERRHRLKIARGEWLTLLGMTITGVVLYNILFLIGITFAPASDGAIITPGLAGLFSLLIAWVTQGDQPAPRVAGGAFLSFLGVLLVGWSSLQLAGTDSNRVLGDVLYAASAL